MSGWLDPQGVRHEGDEEENCSNDVNDYIPEFKPDFDLSEISLHTSPSPYIDLTDPDIIAFKSALEQNLEIFLKARQEHGNHLDNPEWYDKSELACKCWRYIKAYQNGEIPSAEEMTDIANYAVMINSRR